MIDDIFEIKFKVKTSLTGTDLLYQQNIEESGVMMMQSAHIK